MDKSGRIFLLHRRLVVSAFNQSKTPCNSSNWSNRTLLISAVQFADHCFHPLRLRWCATGYRLLMPMVYWQAGWFSGRSEQELSNKASTARSEVTWGLDGGPWRQIPVSDGLPPPSSWHTSPAMYWSRWVSGFFILAGLQRHTTEYWSVVLLATYPCYVFTAFFPTASATPVEANSAHTVTGNIRRFNLWIVRWFTTELNTFPSAHVTATLGGSLVLLHFFPVLVWCLCWSRSGSRLGPCWAGIITRRMCFWQSVLTFAVYALSYLL